MASRMTRILRALGLGLGLAIAAAPALAELCTTCCSDAMPWQASAEPWSSFEASPCCEGAQPAYLPNSAQLSGSSALALPPGLPVRPARGNYHGCHDSD